MSTEDKATLTELEKKLQSAITEAESKKSKGLLEKELATLVVQSILDELNEMLAPSSLHIRYAPGRSSFVDPTSDQCLYPDFIVTSTKEDVRQSGDCSHIKVLGDLKRPTTASVFTEEQLVGSAFRYQVGVLQRDRLRNVIFAFLYNGKAAIITKVY